MRVLLLKAVIGQGQAGDVINVSDGYARNFLLARGLGRLAMGQVVAQAQAREQKVVKSHVKARHQAEQLCHQLTGQTVVIHKKTTPTGRLYAAVPAEEVAQALREQGLAISPDMIASTHGLKQLGSYQLSVHCGQKLEANITVVVE